MEPMAEVTDPLRPETASERMLADLREAMENGRWVPGGKIPTERSLSTKFGIARNTVRRALKILEDEGAIVRDVGRGTFVAQPKLTNGTADLASRIKNASPVEVMEVRLMIEPQAAELCAIRANGAELDAMATCLDHCEAVTSIADFEMWDGLFHQALLAACHNQLLIDIYDAINTVRQKADWAKLKERVMTAARRSATQKQHRRIMAALRARDAGRAAAEMRLHLEEVRSSIVGS